MHENEPLMVDCDKHGRGVAAVVCRHLCSQGEQALGFFENSSVPGDHQAWCQKCEDFFLEQGEMTEAFKRFNDMALVCETCYENIRQQHGD